MHADDRLPQILELLHYTAADLETRGLASPATVVNDERVTSTFCFGPGRTPSRSDTIPTALPRLGDRRRLVLLPPRA
jgi:hypothetical protein